MYRMLARMPLAENGAENNEIRPVFVVTTNHSDPYNEKSWNILEKKIKMRKDENQFRNKKSL